MQKNTPLNEKMSDLEEIEVPVIDLHGEPIHDAWNMFKEFTNNCYTENFTKARVITGKGKMVKEFTTWALNHPKVRNVFLESTGGSFLIKISKKS